MSKKVLIVDDSALVRKQLSDIIGTLDFEIDTAKNGQEAVNKATSTQYTLITMDINMPVMDGIEALKQIIKNRPTPVLMVSSLTADDATITMNALDLGAVDYILKPGTMNVGRDKNKEEILDKVKLLSKISPRTIKRRLAGMHKQVKAPALTQKPKTSLTSKDITKVVLIGSSTGGPGLIEQICASLPQNYKFPVCIVQHMPEQFTKAFVERLNRSSTLEVHESTKNMELKPGNIYIARGGVHMNFSKKVSGTIVIKENEKKGNCFFQPSVNEMMFSALELFDAKNLIAVLLTGIGDDGADAMVALKKAGAYTIGESEESSTVYGMPREAYERGGVTEQLDFAQIVKTITTLK
jgi:two-component system, chemotaxis family, protein-glutamate methylesterase/glutaminase